MTPPLSVVVPVRDAAAAIDECLESSLCYAWAVFEHRADARRPAVPEAA